MKQMVVIIIKKKKNYLYQNNLKEIVIEMDIINLQDMMNQIVIKMMK